MMSNDTMLYKCPGPHSLHGGMFDYTIVDKDNDAAYNEALDNGWFETTTEASEDFKAAQEAMFEGKPIPPPTPTKAEAKAAKVKEPLPNKAPLPHKAW